MIYVKAGVYDEQVIIHRKKINITMYGDGNLKTVVTGNKNFKAGVQTYMTATFGEPSTQISWTHNQILVLSLI